MSTHERLDRIEAILRAARLHEPSCASMRTTEIVREVAVNGFTFSMPAAPLPCDCWIVPVPDIT